ncbi:MAG: FtsX-like permease family protein [Acidobacteria bacterium]|nr:FtsX-like permease family protein [Acidobacteriota bacterium]
MNIGPILRAMRRNKVRFGVIVLEIALTLAIVSNCITLILDARAAITRPSGFDDENLVQVRMLPMEDAYREQGFLDNVGREDLALIRATPGVRAATHTFFLPWQGGGSSGEIRLPGAPAWVRTQMYAADDATLKTLDMELVAGRTFTVEEYERDVRRLRDLFASERPRGADGTPLQKHTQDVVISEDLARRLVGSAPAVGTVLEDSDGDMYRVIGVTDHFFNPYVWPEIEKSVMFYASDSSSFDSGSSYLVRSEPGQAPQVAAALEKRLLDARTGRTVEVQTILEVRTNYMAGKQITVDLMSAVIVLLVLVTSLGIAGLNAFSVAERTRQIGTRRALGARRLDILTQFLLENWLLTTMGIAFGLVLAYAVNFGLLTVVATAKLKWPLLAGGTVLLWAAGIVATLAPALRASRVSPAIATRNV